MKYLSPILIWILYLLLTMEPIMQHHFEAGLVVFSVMMVIPRGLALLGYHQGWPYQFMIFFVMYAYAIWPDPEAVWWVLPYVLWASWLAIWEFVNTAVSKQFHLSKLLRIAALGYWATGAVWALFFLGDIHPLGFSSLMVGLTSAHFHVAGFALAVAVYCLYMHTPGKTNRKLGYGILAGMPAVATGITLTHMGFSHIPEWLAATGFIVLAYAIVWQHVRLALQQPYYTTQRETWLWASACLGIGAAMALVYAMRFIYPIKWFDISNMRFYHGTLNTVGFGWLILRGWLAYEDRDRYKPWDGTLPRKSPFWWT